MSKKFFNSGQHWVWLNAGAISISIIMVVGLLLLIAVRGLSHFWPAEVKTFEVVQGNETLQVMGEIHNIEDDIQDGLERKQYLVKMGNRDAYGLDFKWLDVKNITDTTVNENAIVVERREWGNLYGFLTSVNKDGTVYKKDTKALQDIIERALDIHGEIRDIEKDDIGSINYAMEQLRLDQRLLE